MASPTGVTSCKRFTNKYVPVVIGLRANNVRPYGTDCTDRIDTVRRGRRTLRYPFSIKLKRRNIVNRHGNSPFSIFHSAQAKTGEHLSLMSTRKFFN